MTADQFQRDVIDILDLHGRGYHEKMGTGHALIGRANKSTTIEGILGYYLAGIAVGASASGYSLETIFQATLDELEKEYGYEKK